MLILYYDYAYWNHWNFNIETVMIDNSTFVFRKNTVMCLKCRVSHVAYLALATHLV